MSQRATAPRAAGIEAQAGGVAPVDAKAVHGRVDPASPSIDDRIGEALRRIYKSIDRRVDVALGGKPSTVNRSTGQRYGRRGRLGRERRA